MDLSYKHSDQVSETEDIMSSETQTPERIISSSNGTYLKTCVDCGTTKTPLWRSGPAGPKTLCNACGIRSRKKRRALIGPNKEEKKIKKSIKKINSHYNQNNDNTSTSSSNSSEIVDNNSIMKSVVEIEKASFKAKLMGFGCNIIPMQRPRSNSKTQRRRRNVSEVEEAAFVLMALSCASITMFA